MLEDEIFFNSNYYISSEIKFQIVLNLKHVRLFEKSNFLYFIKKKGHSFFYNYINIYNKCLQYLWVLSLLPFLETHLDKSLHGFRPFRDSFDLFMEIKKIFSNTKNYWYFSLKLFSYSNSQNKFWLLKNLPIEKKLLKSWFNTYPKRSSLNFRNNNFFYKKDINFLLLNYSLTGLVRN